MIIKSFLKLTPAKLFLTLVLFFIALPGGIFIFIAEGLSGPSQSPLVQAVLIVTRILTLPYFLIDLYDSFAKGHGFVIYAILLLIWLYLLICLATFLLSHIKKSR